MTVSWQLASFALLGFVLLAGFSWYEHTHPSSKVLALVATLAAMAALGRVAFAPLPNVKPTTDIVLLSGYALGGAPGFTVGAVAALASNFFFGQGPWTPWQMGAWGSIGVLGAVLARISGRRLGRVPLAIACLLAGFAYGAILDFSTWVTFSGSHTLREYLAFSGAAFGFNVAHAVGNLLFCLAFGPAFVRTLMRFRARFEIAWRPPAPALAASVAVVVACAAITVRPAPATAASSARARALHYLVGAQNRDGGFGAARGQASSALFTQWAAIGLGAAGRDPAHVRAGGGRSLSAALREGARAVRATGDIERLVLALRAVRISPRAVAGRDLVSVLAHRQADDGSFQDLVNLTSFGVLALRAGGVSRSDERLYRAGAWVARQQNADGGFSYSRRGAASGVDDTAGALQALVAAGGHRGAVRRAARFLARSQNRDGGFALVPGQGSNAQSTAWAVQALVAAGRDPDRVRRNGSRAPLAYLRSLIGPDGAVHYSRTSRQTPVWVTAQALTALARQPFPV